MPERRLYYAALREDHEVREVVSFHMDVAGASLYRATVSFDAQRWHNAKPYGDPRVRSVPLWTIGLMTSADWDIDTETDARIRNRVSNWPERVLPTRHFESLWDVYKHFNYDFRSRKFLDHRRDLRKLIGVSR